MIQVMLFCLVPDFLLKTVEFPPLCCHLKNCLNLPKQLKTGKVVSPVKVTLTPSKDGDEEPKEEEILTLDVERRDCVMAENDPRSYLWSARNLEATCSLR